jgi:hypothetical protein
MKIAILGWGSLIWDKERSWMLPIENDKWEEGGPKLSIEFSRISYTRCGALTLVIDPRDTPKVPTRFAISTRKKIDDAVCDLRTREGTTVKNIGYVDRSNGLYRCNEGHLETISIIMKWAKEKGFDAAVWTDLPSNFKCKTGKDFSVYNALEYLHNLIPNAAKKARDYINKAPREVETPLGEALCEDPWFKGK